MDQIFVIRNKSTRRLQQGQSLLEFAVVLPVLLLIVLGVIEFGRAYYQYNTLSKAVREGARYMSMHAYDPIEITKAQNMAIYGNREGTRSPCLPGLAAANISITPRNPDTGATRTNPPRWVAVGITGYTFQPLFSGIISNSVSFAPSVEMRYVGLNAWLDQ